MKKIILVFAGLFLLTACPSAEEINRMLAEMSRKKARATAVIRAKDFSTEGLLSAQGYFFDFGERVHLMKTDEKARGNVRALVSRTGAAEFCASYVLPIRSWRTLQAYCGKESDFRCSPDMIDYQRTYNRFLSLIGAELAAELRTRCN